MRNVIIIIVLVVILTIIIAFWLNKGFGNRKRKKHDAKKNVETSKSKFSAPKNIEVKVVKNQIIANWEKIPEAVHYTAYYSTKPFDGKNTEKVLGPIKETKFEIGCIPNGKYYFRVTATKKENKDLIESEATDLKEVEINNCDIARAPENLVAKRLDPIDEADEVLFTWTPVLDADTYEIVIMDEKGEEKEKRIKIKDPSRSSYRTELSATKDWLIHIEGENNYCKGKSASSKISLKKL